MLDAKFQDHRTYGSGEDFKKVYTEYGCGGHLGYVTWTINFGPLSYEFWL